MQQPQHTDAILQLDISVVSSFLRHLALRQDIPLITCMDKVDPVALVVDLLPFFDEIDHLAGIFLCKRFQRVKTLTILRETDRNHRHALHHRRVL